MNWQHFRAFLWLRWRLLANQVTKGHILNKILLIVFGVGAVASLPEQMRARAMKRPLVVTDRALATLPVFAEIQKALGAAFPVFSGVDPNPTEQNVREGLAAYQIGRAHV